MRIRSLSLLSAVLLTLPPTVHSAFGSPHSFQSAIQPSPSSALLVTFRGRVLDSTGAPLVGAQVTVQPTRRGSSGSLSAVTDANGEFAVALAPGAHTVQLTAVGFVEVSQRLNIAQTGDLRRDFVLQVAGVRENVRVTAPAGYDAGIISSATKTATPLRDVPQSVTVLTQEFVKDQLMTTSGMWSRMFRASPLIKARTIATIW